eukprot:TRINITY_DN27849_c0_g1_i1.p1 TRINITY_DN27849_c0_g1~~TRINITY_DN27849_c0_g1_i1.p1  ORF type:complete len:464 (-),score=98.34 TRINITY_DN27849_c0_g1_i1:83-1474(-)
MELDWKELDARTFELRVPTVTPATACIPDIDGLFADESSEVYCSDWPIQPRGADLTVQLGRESLAVQIVIADAATWSVDALGLRQEGFSHAGFRGSVHELLLKTQTDLDQMRSHYPAESQPQFDAFNQRVDALLYGDDDEEEPMTLHMRDPSGQSAVWEEPREWVARSAFKRSWADDEELGLNAKEYSEIDEVLTTAVDVAALLKKSKRVAVLTGAGVSVESGVPPFRAPPGEDGATWGNFDASKMTNELFNTSDEAAQGWWDVKRWLMPRMREAKPNPAHLFFGELHAQGRLVAVVTQNIDSLHQAGGVPPEKVLELHGHMRGLICGNHHTPLNPQPTGDGGCIFELGHEEALEFYADGSDPKCPLCGCWLRTQTVMFGQPLPDKAMDRAREEIANCDLLFVIGTTLIVAPANELPSVALKKRIPVVMINPWDKSQYDRFATAVVRRGGGEFLAEVMQQDYF